MPRPLRIQYESAWYHIMNRGANHQTIYRSDDQRNLFLTLLEEISKKYLVEIHSYCLMTNHYHLLIRTPLTNLPQAMRHLDGVYTQKFNRFENRDGPLFRGRYKSVLVNQESHILQVSRYIHLNPVEAKICKQPNDYKWSSYPYFITKQTPPDWLYVQYILELIKLSNENLDYEKYIQKGNDEEIKEFYNQKQLAAILGNEEFVEMTLTKLSESEKKTHKTAIKKVVKSFLPEEVAQIVADYFQINTEEIKNSIKGKKHLPRLLAVYLSKKFGQASNHQVGTYFTNLQSESISNIVCRCEKEIKENKVVAEHFFNIKIKMFSAS